MARPERNNVDYFPFICKEGKAMYYIEDKYGNDGFATWIKILRQLAVNNYHYINLSEKVEIMFLSSKCKVSEETLISIINDLSELGEFNALLWVESKIIWSQKFMEHIQDAYNKRKNKCITYEGLLHLLDSLGVRKLSKLPLKGGINTQSKVEKKKEDKIILKLNDVYREFKHLKITVEEYQKLKDKFIGEDIDQILDDIENYKNNKNYTSLYLTANKWLTKRVSEKGLDKNGLTKKQQTWLRYGYSPEWIKENRKA